MQDRRCPSEQLLPEDGWKACRIQGTLDFSLIGILAEISGILAKLDMRIMTGLFMKGYRIRIDFLVSK